MNLFGGWPGWVTITVALTAAGIIVTIWATLRRPQEKAARLAVDTTTLPLNLPLNMRRVRTPDLTIQWQGEPLGDGQLTWVRIANVGDDALTSSCFDDRRPIIFTIGESAEIISLLDVKSSGPWQHDKSPEVSEKSVKLPPDLVPKGASFEMTLLISGKPDPHWEHYLHPGEVVAGMQGQKRQDGEKLLYAGSYYLVAWVLLILSILGLIASPSRDMQRLITLFASLMISIGMYIVPAILTRRRRKEDGLAPTNRS